MNCKNCNEPVVWVPARGGRWTHYRADSSCGQPEPDREPASCSGKCLSGYDIGIPGPGIAYPHPDCPAHGDQWVPHGNEWSRKYVAEHPERFQDDNCPRHAVEPEVHHLQDSTCPGRDS